MADEIMLATLMSLGFDQVSAAVAVRGFLSFPRCVFNIHPGRWLASPLEGVVMPVDWCLGLAVALGRTALFGCG